MCSDRLIPMCCFTRSSGQRFARVLVVYPFMECLIISSLLCNAAATKTSGESGNTAPRPYLNPHTILYNSAIERSYTFIDILPCFARSYEYSVIRMHTVYINNAHHRYHGLDEWLSRVFFFYSNFVCFYEQIIVYERDVT